jgi:hypothetical protein
MKTAAQPFQFVNASYLTTISKLKATTLCELCKGIEVCSDASIFYHTFQSLSRHHFLTEGFSNDFAQWVLAACNRAELAEQLAALDIRDYLSLAELRADLHRILNDYCQASSAQARQTGFEPFYFSESIEVTVPLGREAWTLEEFRRGVEIVSRDSFQFHFIVSRLRLQLSTNDFSLWFDTSLGLPELAQRANRIDIYTNTLESARGILLGLVDEELRR